MACIVHAARRALRRRVRRLRTVSAPRNAGLPCLRLARSARVCPDGWSPGRPYIHPYAARFTGCRWRLNTCRALRPGNGTSYLYRRGGDMGDAVRFADPGDPLRGLRFDGRVAEDFKLASGTWVRAGAVRVQAASLLSPLVSDAMVRGLDREVIGILAWPNDKALRPLDPSLNALPLAQLLMHPLVVAALGQRLDATAHHRGAATIERVVLLDDPPSLDAGEITDKRYVNQGAALRRRAGARRAGLVQVPARRAAPLRRAQRCGAGAAPLADLGQCAGAPVAVGAARPVKGHARPDRAVDEPRPQARGNRRWAGVARGYGQALARAWLPRHVVAQRQGGVPALPELVRRTPGQPAQPAAGTGGQEIRRVHGRHGCADGARHDRLRAR